MAIEFEYTEGVINPARIRVRLDGKLSGQIWRHSDGKYRYHTYPLRSKVVGEPFKTLGECQESLKSPELE